VKNAAINNSNKFIAFAFSDLDIAFLSSARHFPSLSRLIHSFRFYHLATEKYRKKGQMNKKIIINILS